MRLESRMQLPADITNSSGNRRGAAGVAAYVSDCLRLIHSSVQAWQSSDMDVLEHQVSYASAMPDPSLDWQAVEEHLETSVPDISSTPRLHVCTWPQ